MATSRLIGGLRFSRLRSLSALGLTICAVLLAGCSGSAKTSSSGSVSTSALAKRYLGIAEPANDKLEDSFDALEGRDEDNLAASQADLRSAAAVERSFDQQLLRIDFPPAIEATARSLVSFNESRADATVEAAAAPSLDALTGYRQLLSVADSVVEVRVNTIRSQLNLPPADTE